MKRSKNFLKKKSSKKKERKNEIKLPEKITNQLSTAIINRAAERLKLTCHTMFSLRSHWETMFNKRNKQGAQTEQIQLHPS